MLALSGAPGCAIIEILQVIFLSPEGGSYALRWSFLSLGRANSDRPSWMGIFGATPKMDRTKTGYLNNFGSVRARR
jgi:hypothetical protein